MSAAPVPALLALADGTLFRGRAIGAVGTSAGEVVFNTAMTGYQEILTDPSYAGQIVTLTYPHVGNTGVNREDVESNKIFAAGLVIRDLPRVASSWRSTQDLASYLCDAGIVGISDIDTRKLTRILREQGAQNGCLMAGGVDEADALRRARAAPSMAGLDLAKVVSCSAPYDWASGTWALGTPSPRKAPCTISARFRASDIARRKSTLLNGARLVLMLSRTVLVELTATVVMPGALPSCSRLSALGNMRSI